MYDILLHSMIAGCHADLRKEQLREAVEQLTDENLSHLLGALEALRFAQRETEPAVSEPEAAQFGSAE